jgi:membrane protein implicated in regulation of membrane protease activity
VFVRYWLLQLPGWVLLLAVMWLLRWWLDFADWIPWAVLGLWFVKDLALYPLLKHAYDPANRPTAIRRLIGHSGTAEQDLDPAGFVRVRGELWRAEAEDASQGIRSGERVRVVDAEGMTLRVAAER